MARPTSGVGRIEHLGMPRTTEASTDPVIDPARGPIPNPTDQGQPSDLTAVKLDGILTAIRSLESRLDETNRRVEVLRPPSLPGPDPPYGIPQFRPPDFTSAKLTPSITALQQPFSSTDITQPPRPTIPSRYSTPWEPPMFPGPPSTHFPSTQRPTSPTGWMPSATNHQPLNTPFRPPTCWDPPFHNHCTECPLMIICSHDHHHVGIPRTVVSSMDITLLNGSRWTPRDLMVPTQLTGFLASNITLII